MNTRAIAAFVLMTGMGLWPFRGTPAENPAPTVAGWNEFIASLEQLPGRLLARLPVSMQRDPQVQQEIGRLMLAALASSTIDALGADSDYPVFLPQIGQTLNVGQPNADTVYRTARITPGGSYRLDPGVVNWLDTAGYSTGVIQGRWFQCDSQPVPTIRKVALDDVRKSLPPGTKTITPAERERIVRERRAAYQQRPLW